MIKSILKASPSLTPLAKKGRFYSRYSSYLKSLHLRQHLTDVIPINVCNGIVDPVSHNNAIVGTVTIEIFEIFANRGVRERIQIAKRGLFEKGKGAFQYFQNSLSGSPELYSV